MRELDIPICCKRCGWTLRVRPKTPAVNGNRRDKGEGRRSNCGDGGAAGNGNGGNDGVAAATSTSTSTHAGGGSGMRVEGNERGRDEGSSSEGNSSDCHGSCEAGDENERQAGTVL